MAIEQSKFENSTEILDGNEYKACEFRKCRLVYRGGPMPAITQCHFADCEWVFEDAAIRTLSFLRGIYHGVSPTGMGVVEGIFDQIRRV